MKPSVEEFLKFNPAVGCDSLHISGYPRQGKSVHANSIFLRCLQQGEIGLMPGDIFCEWRHFFNYKNIIRKITVLIPKQAEVDFLPETLADAHFIKRVDLDDFRELDIISYLAPGTLVVVYDRCFSRIDRALLWTALLDKCRKRVKYHDIPIVFLDHEAGINYPEIREGKLWSAVEDFAEIFVDFMKGNIRCIFVSQLENELLHKIRQKCIWKIYRRGLPAKTGPGRDVRKYVTRMRRDHYHIFFGGLYVPLNSNPQIKEKKLIWKIIPRDKINLEGSPPTSENGSKFRSKIIKNKGHWWEYLTNSKGEIMAKRKVEVKQ